jgi:signal transduction histidine kinase
VPIIIEGNVLGVLDVQSDSIAGLDEGDADLLRSLANHTAIALVNARLFEQAVRAREEAEEANRLKSRFLATMSHELRTPLSSVINFAQIIKREKLGPVTVKQHDFLERIQASSKHVLGLINDVLDMAKIEAGRMELFREPVDLRVVLSEVISTAKVLIGDKDIELQSDIRPDLPPLNADKTRLRQILLNILSNAIKFTKRGNITVKAWMDKTDVIISVSDTGIGIKEQDFPSVFAEFQQVEGDTSRQYEGTGLGMSIAKRLVEMHGGRIWFESEWDKGSTFTCTLPQSDQIHSVPNISNNNTRSRF